MDPRLKEAIRRADLKEEIRSEEMFELLYLGMLKGEYKTRIRNKRVRLALIRPADQRINSK